MRTEVVRNEVVRLLRQKPFQPFALRLENGDHVIIAHPENIAFDPQTSGKPDFYVITSPLNVFGTFDAVTSIARLDTGEPSNSGA
jgi:hypothetical protein